MVHLFPPLLITIMLTISEASVATFSAMIINNNVPLLDSSRITHLTSFQSHDSSFFSCKNPKCMSMLMLVGLANLSPLIILIVLSLISDRVLA